MGCDAGAWLRWVSTTVRISKKLRREKPGALLRDAGRVLWPLVQPLQTVAGSGPRSGGRRPLGAAGRARRRRESGGSSSGVALAWRVQPKASARGMPARSRHAEHVGGARLAAVAAAQRWHGPSSRRRTHAACQRGRGVERVAQRWSRRRGRIASTSTAGTASNARSSASDCHHHQVAVIERQRDCGSRTPPTQGRHRAPRRPKRGRAAARRGDRERSRVVGRGIESGTRLAHA